MPEAFKNLRPPNTISTKAIAKELNISKDKVKNIIAFLKIEPVCTVDRKNNTIHYYPRSCIDEIVGFINSCPNTKSFFIKLKLHEKETNNKMRQNFKDAMISKYGVTNPSQIPGMQEKKDEAFRQRHGKSFSEYMQDVSGSEEVIAKRHQTMVDKYGEDCYHVVAVRAAKNTDSDARGEKIREYFLNKYGVTNPSQVAEVQQKIKDTRKKNREKLLQYIRDELDGVPEVDIQRDYDIYDIGIRVILSRNGFSFSHYERVPYISKTELSIIEPSLLSFKDLTTPTSVQEEEVRAFIKEFYDGEVVYNSRKIIPPKEIDIYLPDVNVGIEFNGNYWHSSLQCGDKNYHFKKSEDACAVGIRLIHVYEFEWSSPVLREKIKKVIRTACGKVENRIYARNCEIRQITNKEAKPFNDANHLQGHRNAQVTYGLFYQGELVQLMSFSKTRYNRNLKSENSWEIIRGCPGSNNIVVGGVSKLFKHFVDEYDPDSVFSYCDFNKFDGSGYEALGMKFVGYTGPNMWWVMSFTQQSVVPRNPSKNALYKEEALAQIWGAGSKKYVWVKQT